MESNRSKQYDIIAIGMQECMHVQRAAPLNKRRMAGKSPTSVWLAARDVWRT